MRTYIHYTHTYITCVSTVISALRRVAFRRIGYNRLMKRWTLSIQCWFSRSVLDIMRFRQPVWHTSSIPHYHCYTIFYKTTTHENYSHVAAKMTGLHTLSCIRKLHLFMPSTDIAMPISLTVPSQAWVCGRSLSRIVGSNPDGDMEVYFFGLLCVIR
jgi:hypothetical protein